MASRFLPITALCLAAAACASAAPAASFTRQHLPLTVSSRSLTVTVSARTLTTRSINVVATLVARRSLPFVRLRASSPDRRVEVTPGCTFRPLQPPLRGQTRGSPYPPLRAAPLCSLVVRAPRAGSYPLDLRIVDGAGHDWVATVHAVLHIL